MEAVVEGASEAAEGYREERVVKLGIIGADRIGGDAGRPFARAGHEVLFSFSRDSEKLRTLAGSVDRGARAGDQVALNWRRPMDDFQALG
jgi:hypothetical protein